MIDLNEPLPDWWTRGADMSWCGADTIILPRELCRVIWWDRAALDVEMQRWFWPKPSHFIPLADEPGWTARELWDHAAWLMLDRGQKARPLVRLIFWHFSRCKWAKSH